MSNLLVTNNLKDKAIKDMPDKIRIIFADDEKPARDKLAHQLSLITDIEVLGFATTGKEAVKLINELEPDLVLLDIQMPEISGMELLSLLDYKPLIIFTTAYDQFAIQAFEQSSTDYLLKPFPLGRLKDAIDKAKKQFLANLPAEDSQQGQPAQQTPNYQLNDVAPIKRLVSKNGERMTILSPSDLLFIKSAQGNCLAWDGKENHYLSEKLDFLEQSLAPADFVRIHRSYLINIDKIKEIQRWFNGKLMVIMNDENKTELSTSRAGADKLKQLLGL
ncbi:LytR/AlgR family response regulator transcription factor [Colwellia psychrerythraea]|uniref:Two component transcriptional regulator, LytTR family n=1 Tax=Colwellia psychrerythraea TaxID=28229 RepID=A0A099KG45_COLPS|nr:LytTR family DNA-binding domain-containing protein [Colwellia psychrerythraea]KGJ88977.1 two component transcriptional regulator, LytTR family [Colwellia psychrerythraea]